MICFPFRFFLFCFCLRTFSQIKNLCQVNKFMYKSRNIPRSDKPLLGIHSVGLSNEFTAFVFNVFRYLDCITPFTYPFIKLLKPNEMHEPKHAQSSFFLWMNENRNRFYQPGMTQADVAKAAGEEWRHMSDSEKAKWGQKSAQDRERYAHEVAEQREHGDEHEKDDEGE